MAEKLRNVAVIGAGYAGIAAATRLAENGIPVTLFEAGRILGGRARGVEQRGIKLDNGQHILLGAYRETLGLMDRIGVNNGILRLPLALSVPGRFTLKTPALPAPLHLLMGLLMAQGLPLSESIGAILFALRLRLMNFRLGHDISVASLLARHHQDGYIGRLLWEPLCLAALNTPIEKASAQTFLNVLRDSFSHARSDSDLILPRVDLSTLLPDAAATFIRDHGGTIRTGCRIVQIEPTARGITLTRADGSDDFTHVICATAPQHALPLLPDKTELAASAKMMRELSYQPIATVYLQYPEHVRLPQAMLGLTGCWAQWVFDRGQTHAAPGLLAVVISTEGAWQQTSAEQLAARIAQELAQTFQTPEPIWHQVIIEKRATFSCTVGIQRPNQETGLRNFYLAGDYTAGDYPATIEGAVRSGNRCAGLVAAQISS